MARSADHARRPACLARRGRSTPTGEMRSSAAKRQVVADRHRQHQPLGLAVLRDQRHADRAPPSPRAGSSGRRARRRRGSRRRRRAARRTAPAEARAAPARRGRRDPRPRRPGREKEMSRSRSGPAEAADLEQRRRRRAARAAVSAERHGCSSRPIIISTTSSSVFVPAAIGRDVRAVAEHRAFVGQLGDLVHAMRDVEQRQPFLAQALEHHEHLGDVGRGQRRGRLVEDEHARLARQRLGDLDHLPARQRQVLDQRQRMDVGRAGARQRLLGDPALRACGRSARTARGGLLIAMLSATERSGMSDSSWKTQTIPARLAVGWRAEGDLRPVERDAPGVRRD